jgi:tetratricopeptide (TPR) repeat protein
MPYYNPYYVAPAVGVASYDYSQPIDTTSQPPPATVTDPAMTSFDAARESFKTGNYDQALQQTNTALTTLPNDRDVQEFRALCLFALGRYEEAAAPLYSVLSVGPGWDWTTLAGLYPSVDVYTKQLRALESYCTANPKSSAARFVLTYEYLTEGYIDAAVSSLKQIVAMNPSDTLSAKLLRQLDPPKNQPPPAAAPTDTAPPQGATIAGSWVAKPSADTSITLAVQPGGAFTWQVTQKGQTRQFSGASTYGDGILTLAQDKGPAMVGRVRWTDTSHIDFRVVGDGPDDPGLSFSK